MKVVYLSESGYENGLRSGREVAGKWKPTKSLLVESWAGAMADHWSVFAPRKVEQVAANLKKWTQEMVLDYCATLHQQKLLAMPDLKVFPELKGMDQYIDDEYRGYADGAGIDVRWVYLQRYWWEVIFRLPDMSPQALGIGNCSEFYLPSSPHGPIAGKSYDSSLYWETGPSPEPPVPEPTLVVPPPGWGYASANSVNEKGLILDNGGGACYEYEKPRDLITFPAPVHNIILRRCATVEEAVEVFTRYNLYWGPHHQMVGDTTGNSAIIEKSKYHYAVRRANGGYSLATYGGCEAPAMRALCDTGSALFQYYERRRRNMVEIIEAAAPNYSVDLLWSTMLSHNPTAPGCQHQDTLPPGVHLCGFGANVALPKEGRRLWRLSSWLDPKRITKYGCQTEAREETFSFQPLREARAAS